MTSPIMEVPKSGREAQRVFTRRVTEAARKELDGMESGDEKLRIDFARDIAPYDMAIAFKVIEDLQSLGFIAITNDSIRKR